MSRAAIREALASQLDTQTTASAHPRAPRQVNPPALVVLELDQTPSTLGFALYDYLAVVRCMVAGDITHALDRLDDLAEEVEPALEADDTLGGTAHHAVLQRIRGDSEAIVQTQDAHYYVLDVEIEITGA